MKKNNCQPNYKLFENQKTLINDLKPTFSFKCYFYIEKPILGGHPNINKADFHAPMPTV